MRDRKLERLFDRFRQRGDVGALGEVFDATAPELLRVAMSLVRDPGEADDVLQATYLTAIERAERYDAGRRLVPWLLGILVHHVHDLRRRRARRQAEGLPADIPVDQDPGVAAEAEEFHELLEEALGSVSETSRAVLEPYLREGKRAADIARDTGQAPGTVRMQIHRGLDQLRRALPAGVASAAALTALGGRGFAAVRAEVVRQGAAASVHLAAATTGSVAVSSGTAVFGGLTVKQLVIAALVVALVGTVGWMAANDPQRPSVPDAKGNAVEAAALSQPDVAPLAPPAADTETADSARVAAATERTPAAVSAWEAALGGYGGRLLSHAGTPLAGVELTLFQMTPGLFSRSVLGSVGGGLAEDDVLLDRARTDDQGYFELSGAHGVGFRLLGIDLGGPRGAVRLLDVPVARGATAVLGDLVLEPTTAVHGIVVDGEGEPVRGARVRAGFAPPGLAELGLPEFRPESVLFVFERRPIVVDLPGWMRAYADRLPIPTTWTDAEGRFALDTVPAGEVSVFVDHPGRVPASEWLGVLEPGAERDLTIRLEDGDTAGGRVVDADGEPVQGAEVMVAGVPVPALVAHPAGRTDGQGRFSISGLRPGSAAMVAARRTRGEPWTVVMPEGEGPATSGGEVVVTLPARGTIVVDPTLPEGAEVSEVRLFHAVSSMPAEVLLNGLRAVGVEAVPVSGGRFELRGVPHGEYVVLARAGEHVLAQQEVELTAERVEVDLVFEDEPPYRIRVVDDETGEPVARAAVALQWNRVSGPAAAHGWTGADGLVELSPSRERFDQMNVRVEHPGYAVQWRIDAVPQDEEGGDEIRLMRGGTLEVHVHAAGRAVPMDLMLILEQRDGHGMDELPIFASVVDGVARIEGLTEGEYGYELVERFFDRLNPVTLMEENNLPGSEFARGRLEVLPEGVTRFEVDLAAPEAEAAPGETAALRGSLRIDGQPAAGLGVQVLSYGSGRRYTTVTDGAGSYELPAVPPGPAEFRVTRPVSIGQQELDLPILWQEVELTSGESTRLDFDWSAYAAEVVLLDEGGRPVADAWVGCLRDGSGTVAGATTGPDGTARLEILQPGPHQVAASDPVLGLARVAFDVPEGGGRGTHTLRFSAGVLCSGVAEITPGLAVTSGAVSIRPIDSDEAMGFPVEFDGPSAAFEAVGLQPGEYEAILFGERQRSKPVRFSLPEAGTTSLRLVFHEAPHESFEFVPLEKGR